MPRPHRRLKARPSRDEEIDLARRARAGDASARNELWERNLPLVYMLARTESRRCDEPLDDLIQVGALALHEAIGKFEPDRGLRLGTMAIWWIRSRMADSHRRRFGRYSDGTERPAPVSLDAPIDGEETGPGRSIPSEDPTPDESAASTETARIVRSVLATMPAREAEILRGRHFREETLDVLAHQHHVTRERVRQIQIKAEKRLMKRIQNQGVTP